MSLMKIFIIIFFLISSFLFSQQIYFCKGYTEAGEPIDPYLSNKIPVNHSFTILLKSGKENFESNMIFITIEKMGTRFEQTNLSKILRPDNKRNWLAFNHKITEEGNYLVTFKDFNRKKIASSNLIIEKPVVTTPANRPTNFLMPDLKIVFCERITNGNPSGILEKISMLKNNGEVYIYIINNMPLKTSKLLVNIWRKKTPNLDYDEFVDTKKYQISFEWYDTFFRYRFDKKGEYKINFFNEKELLLKTAYISVEN